MDAHGFEHDYHGHVIRERVVLEVVLPTFRNEVGSALPLVGGACHLATDVALTVDVDDHSIFRELLLN